MAEIKELPTWELESDLYAAMMDAIVCCHALHLGVLDVFGASVIERLDNNLAQYHKIHAELVVRGVVHATMDLDCQALKDRAALAGWKPGYVERNREIDQWEKNLDDPKTRARPGIE